MSSDLLRLIIVRHGEAVGNAEKQFVGLRDDSLTERGVRQAEEVAAVLTTFQVAAVYTSPLLRAKATATIISKELNLIPTVDPRLSEQSFGILEGRQHSGAFPSERESRAVDWSDLDVREAPPGGEALQVVEGRMLHFISDLEAAVGRGSVVLVTHVGPTKALLCAALGVSLKVSKRFFLDPATMTIIDWKPRPLVRLVNCHVNLIASYVCPII